jgi:hypothetical protein
MTVADYYRVLDLEPGSTIDEVKKAYRKKVRECHPDINHAPEAKDLFIAVTEAYEFLLTYREKLVENEAAFNQAMEDWRKYRQTRSRRKANVYARASYSRFKNTNFYKTTRIFDGTTIISCIIVSVLVMIFSVSGYIIRLRHPLPGIEKPTIASMLAFLVFGMILFAISIVYLKAYVQSSQKNKSHK